MNFIPIYFFIQSTQIQKANFNDHVPQKDDGNYELNTYKMCSLTYQSGIQGMAKYQVKVM